MSKQSERRNYSVDEIMEQLRQGDREKREREESELVTRPDGSQVVRVRHRKRRSKQPHKIKEVRRKRTGLICLVGGVVILVGLAVTMVVLLARYNSKGYREQLKERLLASTGARVGINDLAVTPFRARAASFEFQWPDGGIAKALQLKGISAGLGATSLVGADWNGEVVSIDSGSLLLGPPDGPAGAILTEGKLPFAYDSFRCSNLQIIYGANPDDAAILVSGTELTFRPQVGGGAQFLMNGGKARIAGWEELRIGRGLAEMKDGQFQVISLRLTPMEENRGEATLRSVKPLRSNAPAQMEVALENYSLAQLLGGTTKGLGHFLGGVVATASDKPGFFTGDPRYLDSGVLELEFSGAEGTLSNFLFLAQLAGILRNSDYKEPVGGLVSGVLQHDREGLSLRNFDFEVKALLKVQGNIDVKTDGSLAGTLRVGLPQGLFLSDAADRYHTIFSEPELGYCWVKVTLLGTIERPLDDFSRTISRGIAPSSEPTGAPTADPKELLEETFRRLTEDPAK